MASPSRFASVVCGNCSRMFALVLSALVASIAGAAPVSFERVQELAGGIASSVQVSYASGAAVKLAQAVSPAETTVFAVAPTNSPDTAFYVVDRGSTGGFVVLSADDRLDPVLVIAPTGKFDATPGTPLYDILCGDVSKRIAMADREGVVRSAGWRALLEADGGLAQSIAYAGLASISDVRVEPLVKSKWNQSYVGDKKVYNYYTPNGYVCGCVATAGAQIMRFHEYPKGNVTGITRTCYVDGVAESKKMYGGTYDWGNMPLDPTSSISDIQCEAIGKLCFDLGVSIYMGWTSKESGTGGYCLKDAFLDVFGYDNAVAYQLYYENIPQSDIENLMLANFDAGYPVEVAIDGNAGGHSIVGDGYGYQGGSLYVHLNMGWGGGDDAWYHLPSIGTWAGFTMVDGVVYNIFPNGTGDLLTGRVTDASTGNPISGVTVKAYNGSTLAGSALTGDTGIYALRLPGGKTYSVVASMSGAEDESQDVYLTKSETTRTSGRNFYLNTGTIGNSWGNDFALTVESDPVAPNAPTGVKATDGTSTAQVRITWSASDGATYYKVYRNTSNSSSSAECIAPSVKTFYYNDTSAEVGTKYYYWVVAGNAAGESGYSVSVTGWRAYDIPDAPTGVSATDGTSTASVTVTWEAAPHATSYSVWRSTSSANSSAVAIASGLTSTTYVDTTAAAGQTYYYWVKATNSTGTSDFSAPDTGLRAVAKPSAPTGVSASDGLSATEIVVSWSSVSTATSYSVWRGTSSSSSEASQIVSGLTVTTYSDTTASAGVPYYYYWVRATNSGGTSDYSAYDTGCLANVVGPSTVTASDGTYAAYVRVTWAASAGATSYEIWRGAANAYSQASKIGTATSTAYDDVTAAVGTRYYYWVKAVTANGASGFSASDSGYRPISVPTGVLATTGKTDGVKVTWTAVTGATSYQIGRGAEGASVPSETSLGSTTSLSYTDATAVPGETYSYFVRAVASSCGYTTGWSSPAAGSRSVPIPDELTATDGTYTDRILVTWPALSGALSYELVRWTEDDLESAEFVTNTTATSFSDTKAVYGVTYYYWLRANFAAGTSDWSNSESGSRDFPKPQNVSAADGVNTSNIAISWDPIDGATSFQVWRYSEERSRNELIGTASSTSYKDSKNVVPGIKYIYSVKAVFPTGTSKLSDTDTGYLKSSSPTPVATDGTSLTQISVTWSAAPGSVTYLLYRGTSSSSSDASCIATTSMLYYNDTNVVHNALYYYWVKNATALDTSDFGSSDAGYIALPGVTRVSATDGASADKVTVSWSAVSGATSYEIWRGASDNYITASRIARNVSSSPYEDTGVTPGAKNWYWVRAVDAGGVGFWGASDAGWRKLSAVTDVAATTNQTDGVKVTWKGTTSGVSFEIKRSLTSSFADAEPVGTVTGSANWLDSTTVPGVVYYYWVGAYSDLGSASWTGGASGWRMISAPATVSATDGTSLDAVTVAWTSATSAKRYEIWRSATTKTDDAELLGTTNKLVWVDASAEPGILYYYWIKSVSALDTSAFSNRDSGYVSTPSPDGVTATDGFATNYVRIAWTESEGALSYAIWRAETNDVSAAAQVKTGVAAATYDDTSAIPGKFYWYWVRPVSAAGPGVFAGPDRGFASLSAPVNVVATSNSAANVTVSWKKTNGAVSYEVFRAETNDVEFATNDVFMTVTTTPFADTNAVPAVKYWYWVRACAEADISPLGGPADGFRLLSAPTGVMATDGTSDEYVRVTWNEAWGAESYEVWRAENSTSTSAASLIVCVTNELEYLDATVNPGTSYTYWLKAVSELHTTGFSSYDKGWRSPPAPEEVSASDGTTSTGVIVEWSPVDGAFKYEVWRSEDGTASTNSVFKSTDATVLAYTDTSAKAGVKYWYWVRTVSAAGTGVFGASDDGFRAVAAPTNLKATDGTSYDYVRVTWTAAAGAESYEICRVPTNELYVATNYYYVTGTTFDDTNAVPGIVYGYSVRTISPLSTSDFAGPDDGWRKFRSVTNLAAGDGTSLDAVELSWTMPEGAEKCNVWRSTGTSVGAAVKIATVDESAYSDTNALHGVKYYYWVNAVADVEGEKGTSNDGWRALYAPGNVAATDGDSTSHVRITWSLSPDATIYEIRRGTTEDSAAMTVIKTLNSPAELVYEDATATAGANYYYSVRAGGTGGWSDCGNVDAGFKALMPPTNVSATDGSQLGKVTVTWNAVVGATYYRVFRADSDDAAKSELSGWQTERSYVDTTCRPGVRYWYYVKAAVDKDGLRESATSGGDSGYAKDDGSSAEPLDLGGGISWPVTDNGDGTTTTNAISFASIEDGHLSFSGVYGSVGSTTTVQTLVKTSLDSESVYTVPATLKIVSAGTAELDLSEVWSARPSLFILGITTEEGAPLP